MQAVEHILETLQSLDQQQLQLLSLSTVGVGLVTWYLIFKKKVAKTIPMGQGWWARGERSLSEDETIHPFTVEASEDEIQDLYRRIDQTRYTEPLEDGRFHYGFNSVYLRKVVSYWRNQFDWNKQVKVLNKYPHFKTKIEGLDIHFIRVRPQYREGQRVLPLMLVHGWPGSFFEFYKILPLLTETQDGLAFEVICPSIPGYGYSEAPHKQGFNSMDAARVFLKLMERLGFTEFYLQGGDWGSLITTNMAQMKPKCIRGLHLNMLAVTRGGLGMLLSLIIGPYLPFLVGFTREDVRRLFPYFEKNVYEILKESGYLHIQATKPDTAGCGVNDSPVGLAAYILEKFSSWTDKQNRDLEDGGLERTGIYVPMGFAAFPQELLHCPQAWARWRYKDIRSYTYMSSGGHFAAFEEPKLLADDFVQFVEKVECKKL
ncbi:epoxide hydrolase 1-like isoform X2 [Alosa pseudoharengus]|uniref:epoxide hydrolase 1-like isoform X2 n=1 Tax=Alosa pseudoharengus TaxID=34774 RepID=UPI003F8C2A2A